MAAVVCQLCRDAKEQGPAFQMLIYPATDSSKESASRKALAEGYFLSGALMTWFWEAYVPDEDTDLADLRLSPLLAKDFTGLPPAFVLTAGYDPLRDFAPISLSYSPRFKMNFLMWVLIYVLP